jgi:hypothetical protein
VDPHDLVHRHREQAERVRIAKVGLRREGQSPEVVERPHPVRRHPGGREPVPVERHPAGVRHQRAQALELKPLQVAAWQRLDPRRVTHGEVLQGRP